MNNSASVDESRRTLYVLLRNDLPIETQLVQSAHAAAEAGRRFYHPEHGIATLVVLSVPDACRLDRASAFLESRDIEHEVFYEPDFDVGNSALCTRPLTDSERRHMKRWPLWKAAA